MTNAVETLLNEMQCSLPSLKTHCKLVPSGLQTVDIDVDDVTTALEKFKECRNAEKKIRIFDEFGVETVAFRNDARSVFDKIQHRIDTISESRQSDAVNVTHMADDVFQVQMNIDGRQVYFQIRCDIETNRFFGVKSEPPVDNIGGVEKLHDLEEIISMMTAAFRDYFRESIMK